MSREIGGMVRAGYEAFNRGDIEGALAPLHPGVEWWPAADELAIGPYRGHHGYRRRVAETREAVPDIQVEIEQLRVVGDRTVISVRFSGHGRDSGIPVTIRETVVGRLREGKIVEIREYRARAEALEAAGLRE